MTMATTTWPDDPVPLLARVLAPLGEVIGAQRLTGGMFATTFRVDLADGRHVVAKTAPTDTDRLMSYELDLLRTEASVYRAAADALPVPHVLLEDQSRAVIPSDVLIVTHLPGVPLSEAGFGPADDDPRTACPQRDLGAAMARLHRLSGPRFGYPNAAPGCRPTRGPRRSARSSARCWPTAPAGAHPWAPTRSATPSPGTPARSRA